MESQNISSPVMNFRQLLEGPGDTPVVDEENFIFNTQEINRRIVASVRVPGTHTNKMRNWLLTS